jgi:hypothetical protein
MWNSIAVTNGRPSRVPICVNTMRHTIGSDMADVGITVFGAGFGRGEVF